MNHLGDQISALVDSELTGAELDRANAHLAACGVCRAEAAAMRQLKRELRTLAATFDPAVYVVRDQGAVGADEALTRRLLAMAGPGGPVPSRRFRGEQYRSERFRRGRYVLWSVVSLFVVGIGGAAFTMGGTGGAAYPEPKITPQLEMFSVEHAITSGDIPFPDPTQAAAGATRP